MLLVLTLAALTAWALWCEDPPVPVIGHAAYEDFETRVATHPTWTLSPPTQGELIRSSEHASSGGHALLVADEVGSGDARARWSYFETAPGRHHYVGARAFQTDGHQQLRVRWIDERGTTVGHAATSTTGTIDAWQRVSLDLTAPEGARYGELQIASTRAGASRAWWDEVTVTDSSVANSGFETAPADAGSDPVLGWKTSTTGGTSATRSFDRARLGRWSLLLTDETTTGAASATSDSMRVQPGVTHTFRGWVHPVSGTTAVDVLWYDDEGQQVGTNTLSGTRPVGRWSLLTSSAVVAPDNAQFAALRTRTSVAGTGTASWDVLSLTPTPPAPEPTFTTSDLGRPLQSEPRTRTSAVFVHEGRVQVASVVTGSPAELQVVDLESGRLTDRVPLPGTTNGHAVVVGTDGRVYVGGDGGTVLRWTPGTGSAQDLGKPTPSATTVFDLAVAPDGTVWGGSYPRGELWRIDPDTGRSTNLGAVRQGQEYARTIAVDERHVYVGVGSSQPSVVRVDVDHPSRRTVIPLPGRTPSGVITELDVLGRYLAVRVPAGTRPDGSPRPTERHLYDLTARSWDVPANVTGQTPTPLDSRGRFHYIAEGRVRSVDSRTGTTTIGPPTTTKAGRDRHIVRAKIDGTSGEWLIAVDPTAQIIYAHLLDSSDDRRFSLHLQPGALPLKAVVEGSDGTVLVSGYGGSDPTVVDVATGSARPLVSGQAAPELGELEGGIPLRGVQYLGTYTGARIWRHDPAQPVVAGRNPLLVSALGAAQWQDRPTAFATDGEHVYVGTVPAYGTLGGGLGTIDGTTMRSFNRDIVPGQAIVSLAARDGIVYGGTSRWGGLGATPITPTAQVFAYDTRADRMLWSVAPGDGTQSMGAVVIGPQGTLWAADGGTLHELDPTNGETLRSITVDPTPTADRPTYRDTDLVSHGGYLYLRARGRLHAVDPVSLRIATPLGHGVTARGLVRVGDRLVVGAGDRLVAVDVG
ncbi:hypothetical protein ASG73_16425 [Janibacter sp. Soil728]|nr:hypothetical protein ASG73_16425 [Janibacter sp. Soil728]